VRRARQAHRLEAAGLSSAEAAGKLGIKPYPAQKLYAQVRNFSAGELDAAIVRLAALDHALKGGSRLANELELERALVEITEPQAA
jgi:DNA polymerase III delta subunit